MLHRTASFSHRRHASPPSRNGSGRSSRHSPPSYSLRSFRSRFPPPAPRGIVRYARGGGTHFRGPPPPMVPHRSSSYRTVVTRRPSGRFAAVRGVRPPPPHSRIPYHCRMDISPRRSPCRSRSRSPLAERAGSNSGGARPRHSSASSTIRRRGTTPPSRTPPPLSLHHPPERGRVGGRRPIYRRGGPAGRRPVSDRSKFIGNFGRPINHPPAYEVSPDRTVPPASVSVGAAENGTAAVVAAAAAAATADTDGPVILPSAAPTTKTAPSVADEMPSNRDELYAKMVEAKKSENLDEYYRLRDALNAFDKRNPHLAYRGSGAIVVAQQPKPLASSRRKRCRDEDDAHREEEEEHHDDKEVEEEEKKKQVKKEANDPPTASRKQRRSGDSPSDRMAEKPRAQRQRMDAVVMVVDGLEEVDCVGKQFADEGEEEIEEEEELEVGFDLVENDHLDHGDDEMVVVTAQNADDDESVAEHGHQNEQRQSEQAVTQLSSSSNLTTAADVDEHQHDNLWAPFSHLDVAEQLRLLRDRIVVLERLQVVDANDVSGGRK